MNRAFGVLISRAREAQSLALKSGLLIFKNPLIIELVINGLGLQGNFMGLLISRDALLDQATVDLFVGASSRSMGFNNNANHNRESPGFLIAP